MYKVLMDETRNEWKFM